MAKKKRKENVRPFVITAEVVDFFGCHWAVPLGVELAICTQQAWEQAVQRWPFSAVNEPAQWEQVPPEFRLAALEADRRM